MEDYFRVMFLASDGPTAYPRPEDCEWRNIRRRACRPEVSEQRFPKLLPFLEPVLKEQTRGQTRRTLGSEKNRRSPRCDTRKSYADEQDEQRHNEPADISEKEDNPCTGDLLPSNASYIHSLPSFGLLGTKRLGTKTRIHTHPLCRESAVRVYAPP